MLKDVLPIVRENINKIYITLNNSDTFFQSIIDAYSLPKQIVEKWIEYRNQNEYGIIDVNTITKNYLIYNSEYILVFDSKSNPEFDPVSLINHKSYFFTGNDFNTVKSFLEHHSGQEIEINHQNVAFYFVVYCLQNKILVNTAKINNYFDRIENDTLKILNNFTEYFSAQKLNNKK